MIHKISGGEAMQCGRSYQAATGNCAHGCEGREGPYIKLDDCRSILKVVW